MPEKTFDGYIAEVKKRKADAAQHPLMLSIFDR
jgi:hypothetical protein